MRQRVGREVGGERHRGLETCIIKTGEKMLSAKRTSSCCGSLSVMTHDVYSEEKEREREDPLPCRGLLSIIISFFLILVVVFVDVGPDAEQSSHLLSYTDTGNNTSLSEKSKRHWEKRETNTKSQEEAKGSVSEKGRRKVLAFRFAAFAGEGGGRRTPFSPSHPSVLVSSVHSLLSFSFSLHDISYSKGKMFSKMAQKRL